jgi:predicted SAM-dependent methyltransferase
MIETVNYKENLYPKFQTNGFASRFCMPFAKEVCKGNGVDIGCGKEEWAFPGAIPIEIAINSYDAINFPHKDLDYLFSSHCLEHLYDWVYALDYWYEKLKIGGVLFLYLPAYSQKYHRPWSNKKHKNIFTPEIIKDYLDYKNYKKIFVSGIDLYDSFMAMAEK